MPARSVSFDRPILQPSALGKFVQLDACPQYFKFHIEDTGLETLNHEKQQFKEAFREDNIIEKKRGDDFEEEVFENITEAASTVINVDDLTLADVAQTLPDLTHDTLTDTEWSGDRDTVATGAFEYHGVPAADIRLADPDGFLDAAEVDLDPDVDPDHNQPDYLIGTHRDRDNPIKAVFFYLRDEYTAHLFEYLIETIDSAAAIGTADFPIPTPVHPEYSPLNPDRDADDPVVVYQPSFTTQIGDWPVAGDADIVMFWPVPKNDDDSPTDTSQQDAVLRVVDVKVASEEQTYHQIQTVAYAAAIDQLDTVSNHEFTVETGVITQHAPYLPLTRENVPSFERDSRQADLNRLTKSGGVLDAVFNTPDDEVSYQLDSKCTGCQYNEPCYIDTIENAGLELLGLGRGMQQQLVSHGVSDLNDLADLAENAATTHTYPDVPWDVDPRDSTKPDVDRTERETYNALAEVPGLGEQLPHLIQEAQILLSDINPDHRYVRGGLNKAQYLTGAGKGDLPSDAHLDRDTNGEYRSGSMIRVYINVQHDHIRDSVVGIGFHVTASASTTDGISWSMLDDEMPDEISDACENEITLLTGFANELFDAIETVADGINLDGYDQSDPFLHFFTYTEEEKRILEEKLALYVTGAVSETDRAKDEEGTTLVTREDLDITPVLHQLRGVLGMRGGANQEMVSTVAPDIESRLGVSRPTEGLVNIYTEFFPAFNAEERFERTDWEYEPDDHSRAPRGERTIDLTDVFYHRLFNSALPYEQDGDAVEFLLGDRSSPKWYEARVRTGAQIPIAYLWAAAGRITDAWVDEIKDEDDRPIVNPYRYHGTADDTDYSQPIIRDDVEALLERFCECLRHVEQGIMVKKAIEVPDTYADGPVGSGGGVQSTIDTGEQGDSE